VRVTINQCLLELVQGDITEQEVDAVVNAANSQLAGGGGVDGAIHRRGGPDILHDTQRRYPAGCPTGSAVISVAGRLPARYVIHGVGPRWHGGQEGEPELLARVYRRCLELACGHECHSVALPAISTGVYSYPLADAARVAVGTAIAFLRQHGRPGLVRFVLFGDQALGAFQDALRELAE
jgi:O-acetyl-ADP-ribose deacetylase (regulator of RNase III)